MTPKRILVVDDEEDVQALLGQVLWDRGYEVEFAASGAEALRRVELGGVDLVVLDLILPDFDGHDVLERLRDLAASPPVVVLSVRSDYASFVRALRFGAEAYLVKPFRMRELLAACVAALESRHGERRRAARYAVSAEVRILVGDGSSATLGELVDLSASGAQVRLGAPLAPLSGVSVRLQTAEGRSLELEGRVAWRGLGTHGFAHGVGFVNLTPERERGLRNLIGVRA